MRKLILIAMCLLVVGCAHEGVKDAPLHYGKELDLTTYPEQAVGVRVTPALEQDEATVVEVSMSDAQVGGELRPGRVSYPGWFVAENGDEAFVQYVLIGNFEDGRFKAFAIIDDMIAKPKGNKIVILKKGKILPLSSRTDCTWEGEKVIPIDRVQFHLQKSYRKEVVEKYGTSVGKYKLITGFDLLVKAQNKFATDYGDIYSPLSEEDVKRIAKINPGYTGFQRFVLRNQMVFSLNPIEMVARTTITLWETAASKPRGWDYNSELTGAEASAMISIVGQLRQKLIGELNQRLAQKDAEIASLKQTVKKQEAVNQKPQVVFDKTVVKRRKR